MENASKALLIAGAILIAILLIAVSMLVYNNAKGVIDTAGSNMSDTQKTAFNSQFEMYNGTQSGSNLKTIISKVNTNNNNKDNITIEQGKFTKANITYANGVYTIATSGENLIRNQAQYDVRFYDDNDDGLVDKLDVALRQ